MRNKRVFLSFLAATIFLAVSFPVWVGGFSFAVISDIQDAPDNWENSLKELRKLDNSLILIAGDFALAQQREAQARQALSVDGKMPLLVPAIGNHAFDDNGKDFNYTVNKMIPATGTQLRYSDKTGDYVVDFQNTRFILLDGYSKLGTHGVINDKGRSWVEKMIITAPASIEDIFICYHEPAFPKKRHVGDSFDEDPALRDAFWQMLSRHKDKVRAVFAGHTHYYARTTKDGIQEIDDGSAGATSENDTIVEVSVDGKKVDFKVLQAANGKETPFAVTDSWEAPSGF
jgi:predicted phosphodiesterase